MRQHDVELPRPKDRVYVGGGRIPLPAYVHEVSPDGQMVLVSTHDEMIPMSEIRTVPLAREASQ